MLRSVARVKSYTASKTPGRAHKVRVVLLALRSGVVRELVPESLPSGGRTKCAPSGSAKKGSSLNSSSSRASEAVSEGGWENSTVGPTCVGASAVTSRRGSQCMRSAVDQGDASSRDD